MEPAPKPPRHDYLRRLAPQRYQGHAAVHWTFTVARRQTGWLDASSHALWREALLHTCARYQLAAPLYCLMPDHAHLLLKGLAPTSEQRTAVAFLRRHTASLFTVVDGAWQKQPYDHVLREEERARGALMSLAHYIAQNPVRAGLVAEPQAWPYTGSVIVGYPSLAWRRDDFWDRYWQIDATTRP